MGKITGAQPRIRSFKHAAVSLGSNATVLADTALDAANPTVVAVFAAQPDVPRNLTVKGNDANVAGNVTITGGGSPFIPWSIKNNTIDGNLTVSDLAVTWVGALFNRVGKNLSLTNITITDVAEEGGSLDVYVVRNTIGRNLNCSGLSGAASYGNIVARNSTGQCA